MPKPQRKAAPAARKRSAVTASNDNARKGPGVAKVRLLPTPIEQLNLAIEARNGEKNVKKRAILAARVEAMKAELSAKSKASVR